MELHRFVVVTIPSKLCEFNYVWTFLWPTKNASLEGSVHTTCPGVRTSRSIRSWRAPGHAFPISKNVLSEGLNPYLNGPRDDPSRCDRKLVPESILFSCEQFSDEQEIKFFHLLHVNCRS